MSILFLFETPIGLQNSPWVLKAFKLWNVSPPAGFGKHVDEIRTLWLAYSTDERWIGDGNQWNQWRLGLALKDSAAVGSGRKSSYFERVKVKLCVSSSKIWVPHRRSERWWDTNREILLEVLLVSFSGLVNILLGWWEKTHISFGIFTPKPWGKRFPIWRADFSLVGWFNHQLELLHCTPDHWLRKPKQVEEMMVLHHDC